MLKTFPCKFVFSFYKYIFHSVIIIYVIVEADPPVNKLVNYYVNYNKIVIVVI